MIGGRLVVRHVAIAGLGHAWSGGDDALAFNDARAPDASQLVGDFLYETLA
jgi:poly(3-hydroxybutyrate) depolymerase